MKRTPLYEVHSTSGGRIIDFGGWSLPVQYTGIIEEHCRVRTAAGLFDVSHMGEITVKGDGATSYIQKMITNDISNAAEYQVVYSPMCYPDGGVVDDLLVYKFSDDYYLLIVNASNADKDFEWLKENVEGDVKVENVSDKFAQLAIQGPKAEEVLQKLTDISLAGIRFFRFKSEVDLAGIKAIVSRTGYTGEDGFEMYVSPVEAKELWNKLMEAGREEGLVPVGLGARDTLRFEAALPLYGHEISKDISPLEAGLGKFVKLHKSHFIGIQALKEQKENGVPRTLVGLEMIDRGIPRNGCEVHFQGEKIGFVTTGSFSPSLSKNIGLALVDSNYSKEGTQFDVLIRNKPLRAKVTAIPFIKKSYK